MEIADEEGIDAVSMRKVARHLGAGTMSLYHYVHTKDDLLALMDDAMMAELIIADGEMPEGWRARLTLIASRSFAAWMKRPWTLSADEEGFRVGRNGLRHMEQSLEALEELAIEPALKFEILLQVDDYVIGFALRERQTRGADMERALEMKELSRFVNEELATGRYPQLSGLFPPGSDAVAEWRALIPQVDDGSRFERGFTRLLDGIEVDLKASGAILEP